MYHHNSNQVLIETYRNFEIFFDTEHETFHCISDYYDTEQKKKTYAATKTAIDTYIKENGAFRPFFVHSCRSKGWGSQYPVSSEDCLLKITGIRKDGRFVSEKGQVSEYDEKDTYLVMPENESVFEELAPLLEELETYERLEKEVQNRIKEVSKKLKLISLKDHKITLNS